MNKFLNISISALLFAAMMLCSCTSRETINPGNTSVPSEQSIAHTHLEAETTPRTTVAEIKTSAPEQTLPTQTIVEAQTTAPNSNVIEEIKSLETTAAEEKTTLTAAEEKTTASEPAEDIEPPAAEPPVVDRFASLGIPEDVGYSYYTEEIREQMLEHGIDYDTVEQLIDVGFIFPEMLEMSHEERCIRSFTHSFRHFDGSIEEMLELLPKTEAYIAENYPDIITKHQYGSSVQGRSLDAYFFSNCEEPKQKIMLTFAMHGYEGDFRNDGAFLTESAYAIMLFYAENPEFLGEAQLIFCPMLNPDGVYAPKNAKYGREQSKGIDMNRDFKKGLFRAAESIALRDFMQEVEPDILIDFHGWLNATYGDSSLAKIFNKHTKLYHWDKQYGSSQGYLIGYAHKQGIRSLLVEHEHFTEINSIGIIYALNEICSKTE